MWYVFFVVGGLWFWSLVLLEFIVLSIFVHSEDGWEALGSVLGFLLLITLFGDAKILIYLKDNPWDILRLSIMYAFIGFGWGLIKYFYEVKHVSNKICALKQTFNSNIKYETKDYKRRKDITLNHEIDIEEIWKSYLHKNLEYKHERQLNFYSQGSRIVFWMTYWPISAFWTFFTDILKNFGEWCYETFLIKLFKKIHNNTIGRAAKLNAPVAVKTPHKTL